MEEMMINAECCKFDCNHKMSTEEYYCTFFSSFCIIILLVTVSGGIFLYSLWHAVVMQLTIGICYKNTCPKDDL